jgi:hypothetical protein
MPILPLVDLFILMGSGSFAIGVILKAIAITTHYRPSVLEMAAGNGGTSHALDAPLAARHVEGR